MIYFSFLRPLPLVLSSICFLDLYTPWHLLLLAFFLFLFLFLFPFLFPSTTTSFLFETSKILDKESVQWPRLVSKSFRCFITLYTLPFSVRKAFTPQLKGHMPLRCRIFLSPLTAIFQAFSASSWVIPKCALIKHF